MPRAVPRSSNWLMVDGKPLLIVFDGANLHAKESPLVAPQFSVRWMASQLQVGNIPSGYWSWMDVSAAAALRVQLSSVIVG